MADHIDSLAERVETLDSKVGAMSASVDQRFDAVDASFVEQRQYTEFAFSRLEAKVDDNRSVLSRVERKLDHFIDRMLPPKP